MEVNKLMIISVAIIAFTITVILCVLVYYIKLLWKELKEELKKRENNFWKTLK